MPPGRGDRPGRGAGDRLAAWSLPLPRSPWLPWFPRAPLNPDPESRDPDPLRPPLPSKPDRSLERPLAPSRPVWPPRLADSVLPRPLGKPRPLEVSLLPAPPLGDLPGAPRAGLPDPADRLPVPGPRGRGEPDGVRCAMPPTLPSACWASSDSEALPTARVRAPVWTPGAPRDRAGKLTASPTLRLVRDDAPRSAGGIVWRNPGGVLLSQGATPQVPSALAGLTAVFGMGTGVSPPPWPPETVRSPGSRTISPKGRRPSPA